MIQFFQGIQQENRPRNQFKDRGPKYDDPKIIDLSVFNGLCNCKIQQSDSIRYGYG